MSAADQSQIDHAWRAEMMAQVASGDVQRATDALLSLAYNEVDRIWIESFLIGVIDGDYDLQIGQLAVISLGHVARIHGEISDQTIARLMALEQDPQLASRARNALDDVQIFARRRGK